MNRTAFLRSVGFGGPALMALLTACSKDSVVPAGLGPVDFSLDLTDPNNAALAKKNGYVIVNGIVVARVDKDTFAAATHTCSHENRPNVLFDSGTFYCDVHGARFDTAGKGLNGYASKGLTVYSTELSGTSLRIYS